MSEYGLKISLPGFDVRSAAPEDCSVHSGYASPKIKSNAAVPHFGTIRHAPGINYAPGTTVNVLTINHGYSGYIPACIVNWTNAARTRYGSTRLDVDAFGLTYYVGYTTATQFKLDLVKDIWSPTDTSGLDYTFRYYIFAETGA